MMKRRIPARLAFLLTVVALTASACRGTPKTLVVGTSMDWEPFEYIAEDGSFAGFDIDLMEEIGRRLNKRIEWREYAFEVLIDRLADGELDAVIAAMNPTPDRRAWVDFTEPYYTSVDAILVATNSAITLSGEQDLEGHRIGVLPGTVQEAWVEATFQGEILRYDGAEHAIAALEASEVDAVVISYYAAQPYFDRDGVVLALRSEASGDRMAIAVQKDNSALRNQISAIIATLEAEGFLEELALKYLSEE
jgi:arginine/lysine/histidine transporter system substrate-binding protein